MKPQKTNLFKVTKLIKIMKALLSDALKEIKPHKEEEEKVLAIIKDIIRKINNKSKKITPILGGSGAKGTWLKTFDADIFVKFDYCKYKDKSDNLSEILEKILKKKFSGITRLHGSRDYFQIKKEGYTFEIIPILGIKKAEQAKNITDVSPLHAQWVKKNRKYADEIRLAKQFFKAQNAYGAESHIKGFSGYVCEILAIYYGSFLGLIKNAAKWKEKSVIDINKDYKGKNVMAEMNKSKLNSPLIIIDPVQKDRNAAAALSFEKFDIIRKKAKEFLTAPSISFFRKKETSISELREKYSGKTVISITAKAKDGKNDVIGSKIMKAFEYAKKKILENDFKLAASGWEWDEENPASFYFVIDSKELSKEKERKGPMAKSKRFVEDFKNKHKRVFIKEGRVYAYVTREFRTAEELMKSLKDDEYLKIKLTGMEYQIFN